MADSKQPRHDRDHVHRSRGRADLLEYLLSKHASTLSVPRHGGEKEADIDAKASPIELALTLAIQQGHLDLVNILLKYGCDIKVAVSHGITPVLVSAAQSGSEAMVRLLLSDEVQSDVNAVDKVGISPLAEAAEGGHLNIGRILLEHGADPNLSGHEDGTTTPLLVDKQETMTSPRCCCKNRVHLQLPPISNQRTNRIDVADAAAQQGHASTIDLLLRHDADPNAVDNDGTTALFSQHRRDLPILSKAAGEGRQSTSATTMVPVHCS